MAELHAARRAVSALLLGIVLAAGLSATAAADSWTGRYSLYVGGSFSAQHANYTCVGASIQMMLNLINGTADHSAEAQLAYWRYGRDHSRYQRRNNGVDPIGWIAALDNWGAGRYEISLSSRYQKGLRRLAAAMRATDRPVGLFVDAGGHAWVMSGFAATADPARSDGYKVTEVQVLGPLYPNGTVNGRPYDPPPGTWLTVDQLRKKFTPMQWRVAPEWRGRWLAVVAR